jgi:hypothetical protein
MDAHQERMGGRKNAWRKDTTACQEATEACLKSKEPTSVEVSPRRGIRSPQGRGRSEDTVWGPGSTSSVPLKAAETDPRCWWVPEEVGRRRAGTARRKGRGHAGPTTQRRRSPGMQQWHKGPRPKGAATSEVGERAPDIHWIGGCVGPITRMDATEKRKSLSPAGKRTPAVRPAARRYPSSHRWTVTFNYVHIKQGVDRLISSGSG